jgi:hypothetical protein
LFFVAVLTLQSFEPIAPPFLNLGIGGGIFLICSGPILIKIESDIEFFGPGINFDRAPAGGDIVGLLTPAFLAAKGLP